MDKYGFKKADVSFKRIDWLIAAAFAAAGALLFYASMAPYAYPGQSAKLMAVWRGLDVSAYVPHPFMRAVSSLFGYGNALSPLCGAIAAAAAYLLVSRFIRTRFDDEEHGGAAYLETVPRTGGIAAALVFLLAPCVRTAASHLDQTMFDTAWMTVALVFSFGVSSRNAAAHAVSLAAMGVAAGLGFSDTPLFLLAFPVFAAAIAVAEDNRSGSAWRSIGIFAILFFATFLAWSYAVESDYSAYIDAHLSLFSQYVNLREKNWIAVFILAVLPFALSSTAAKRLFGKKSYPALWIYQSFATLLAFLAVVTPVSPSALMRPYGMYPVGATLLVAAATGYAAAYWHMRSIVAEKNLHRLGSRIVICFFAATFAISSLFSFFKFDRMEGAFADIVADRIVADLGARDWFITDGTVDDHLRLSAARAGKELHLVCLQRDFDGTYLDHLASVIAKTGIGGDRNSELGYSLKLGILPFVQDLISWAPDITKRLATYGAPDLWRYNEKAKIVPELLFFGADESVKPDVAAWESIKKVLPAPERWGSYRLWKEKDPMARMRLDIRRHIGFVANNRGVTLLDEGREDEAFDMFETVLGDIDADNVCALFNELEMMRGGYRRALAKKGTLTRRFNEIKDDPDRRYRLRPLYNYYGYIRNPDIFIRLGFDWARFGRRGEALSQIRRAIDFIPSENRNAIMNIMAALYADEYDKAKSRSIYEAVLAKDAGNHDALIGLMRLELMNGNKEKALEFLDKAIAESGDDPRARVEKAMAHLMRNEVAAARALLKAAADADVSNMQTWSLLAAATIQAIDAEKDVAKKAALTKELETDIIGTMEKQARDPSDYHLQTTRAFLLLHKGEKFRREARDAFMRVSKRNPAAAATSDIILGLDISLNDVVDAERQAKEVLRRNRRAPLANYVMGSIALQRGDWQEAEAFLRRAIDTENPLPLALNDYAEALRRRGNAAEAETYARKTVQTAPDLYVAWDTLASAILENKGSLDEAESCSKKACELSRDKTGRQTDIRMFITLARIQKAKGEMAKARGTARRVAGRISELSPYERQDFEEFMKGVK